MELVDIFPAFGLRIECGPVTLRAMRESDVPRVAELAAGGIHAEGAQPFLMPWNLSETQPLESLKLYYRTWAAFSPESWRTLLAVERDGVMVGAWADNPNSHRVSEKCGYLPNGYQLLDRQGERVRQDDFVVTPETFIRPPYEVDVTGVDAFRRAIGLDSEP